MQQDVSRLQSALDLAVGPQEDGCDSGPGSSYCSSMSQRVASRRLQDCGIEDAVQGEQLRASSLGRHCIYSVRKGLD